MWVFTTREIAIIFYAIILLMYILFRKKGTEIIVPIIKAACHIKLVVPFLVVLAFSSLFVWLCTSLPFWDWVYVKDIIFWTLFAGVPVCFNATSRTLEDKYFKNILTDNLKFTALAEFFTGTFTFNILIELILQPILVVFVVLQATAENKEKKIKKVVDGIVATTGFIILALTIKSFVDSLGQIELLDISVSFLLPIVLSVIYLPLASGFSVYAKYELLFLRMGFKEPNDPLKRFKHRLKIVSLCKLSYKKVRRFLYEYLPKMYVEMDDNEFDVLIKDFKESF